MVAVLMGMPNLHAHTARDGAELEQYLRDHLQYALNEQYRTGILASITITQAAIESDYGRSELARMANNHFGLKCKTSWTGNCYTKASKEQDRNTLAVRVEKSEFRAYASVAESYSDRSDYLLAEARYKHLFSLPAGDYAGWAQGLQDACYATDVNYAKKLISFIEQHKLYQYDQIVSDPTLWANVAPNTNNTQLTIEQVNREGSELQARVQRLERIATSAELERNDMRTELTDLRRQLHSTKIEHQREIAELKARIAELERLVELQEVHSSQLQTKVRQLETVQQSMLRLDPFQRYFTEDGSARTQVEIFPQRKKNAEGIFFQAGKKATSLPEGKTLLNIASDYQIEYKDLLAFNDVATEDADKLPKGCYIYLEPKASSCAEIATPQHQVAAGETMYSISQLYGIKLSKLYQRNLLSLEKGEQPAVGEFIFINDKASSRPRIDHSAAPALKQNDSKFGKGGTH